MNLSILLVLSLTCPPDKVLIVDLNSKTWTAMLDGKAIKSGEAIGGRNKCRENPKRSCRTPVGEFKVYVKYGYSYRSGAYPVDCEDRKKCGARMYYAAFFHRSGYAIHGSDMMVGRNVSHGCVRIFKKDAKWLNQHFLDIGTRIIVLPY